MGGKDEKLKPDDPEQSRRFAETAKRLETDESGKVFEKAMNVIANQTSPNAKSNKKAGPTVASPARKDQLNRSS